MLNHKKLRGAGPGSQQWIPGVPELLSVKTAFQVGHEETELFKTILGEGNTGLFFESSATISVLMTACENVRLYFVLIPMVSLVPSAYLEAEFTEPLGSSPCDVPLEGCFWLSNTALPTTTPDPSLQRVPLSPHPATRQVLVCV